MIELYVSLVIYNSSDAELSRLMQSLELQLDVNFKLLVHDNRQCGYQFQGRNFSVDYERSALNLGFGRAHNANFLKANPEAYFLVINPDVYFEDPLLFRKLIDRTPKNTLSSVRILNPDGSIQDVHRLLPRFADIVRRFILNKLGVYYPYRHSYTLSHIDKTREFRCPNISGCFMLFAPVLFSTLGGFDPNIFLYFEDIDISRRSYKFSGGANRVFGDLTVFHAWKKQGYKNMDTFKAHVLSAVYYFQKYGVFRDTYSKKVNQEFNG